jgi:hypothetical protein
MDYSRIVIIGGLAVGIATTERCGGQLADGHFDPDGDFHSSDGAVLFGPGTSCVGYDAAGLVGTAPEWQVGIVVTSIACDMDAGERDQPFCISALPAGLSMPASPASPDPNGYYNGPFYHIECEPPGMCNANTGGTNVSCPGTGETGDFYCTEFYQQFVAAPGAQALASCQPCADLHTTNDVCSGPYVCIPNCCSAGGFCVQRGDAAAGCEYPCQP